MLILTLSSNPANADNVAVLRDRETGEVIARVTVIDLAHGRVRLGFTADQSITIDRGSVDKDKRTWGARRSTPAPWRCVEHTSPSTPPTTPSR